MQIRANTATEIRPDVAVRAALSPQDAMSARVAMQTQGGAPDVSSMAAIFTISKWGWLHQFSPSRCDRAGSSRWALSLDVS